MESSNDYGGPLIIDGPLLFLRMIIEAARPVVSMALAVTSRQLR